MKKRITGITISHTCEMVVLRKRILFSRLYSWLAVSIAGLQLGRARKGKSKPFISTIS